MSEVKVPASACNVSRAILSVTLVLGSFATMADDSSGSVRAIGGTDYRATTGADLLIVGRANFVASDSVSVLGQTIFVDGVNLGGISVGLQWLSTGRWT